MKLKSSLRSFLPSALVVISFTLAAGSAHAVSANWTGAGTDALWSNTDNWSATPVPGTGDTATFNAAAGAGGVVIDLGAGVTVNTISFVGPSFAAYTIGAGGANAQTLTLNGSGNAGLASSGTATTTQITIDAAIIVNNTQQWVLNQGANPWIINGNVTPNGTAGSTKQVKINGHKATFNGLLADQVGGAKLQMSGANAQTATLTNPNNSFTGGLYFDNGSVSVNSIDLIGSNSAAGAGGDLLFGSGFGGGTLIYTGTGNTTNRVVTVNHGFWGPTLNQSGASGNLNYTADMAFSAAASAVGSATVTLTGATAGTGEFSGKLVDNGTTGFTPTKAAAAIGATSLQLHSVDGVTIGSALTGAAFAGGTTVTAINTGTRTITLSTGTIGAIAQGANVSVGGVENITYLTKSGSGTWTLSGANTHSGFTKISAGTLTLANSLALQNSPIDMVGSIAGTTTAGLKTTVTTLTLGGLNGTASPKNLSSIFTTTSGGYNGVTALTLNPRAAATFSYSGVIADGATGMTLTKTGEGTQILGGVNIYTGTTIVNNGTLLVNSPGSLDASSAVSVTGGTIGGTGTVGGAVTVAAAGSVAPGASAGQLTVGSLDLVAMANSGSGKLKFELDTDTASSDRIAVTGALTIDSGTPVLGFNDFQFSNLGGLAVGPYTLITADSISGDLDSGNLTGTIGSFTGTLQKTSTTIELVVTAASGFAAWQSANGTSGGLNDDHDGDGVDNGTEFFIYGPVANSGFTALPGVTNTAGTLSVTWTKAAGYTGNYGPDYVVETSATLGAGSWTAEKADPEIGFTVTFPSATEVKYTFPAGTKNFARLRVTGP